MPHNVETNEKLGVYKDQWCGKEMVVAAGSELPSCPNHPGVITVCESIIDDNIVRLVADAYSDHPVPRFNLGDQVIFVGVGHHKGRCGDVVEVIEGTLDFVHRYCVRLNDGTTIRCFGFELDSFANKSKSA